MAAFSRRFEIKGEAAGRIVIDDYAHHPAEVRATLAAARAAFKRRIVAVFQPHRYTRMRDLFDEFLTAFDDADVLYLLDIYPAGEEPIADVSVAAALRGAEARGHLEVHYLGGEENPAARRRRFASRAMSSSRSARATFINLAGGCWPRLAERRSSMNHA